VGAERGVRVRALLQAAHRSGLAARGGALDARADRRGGGERRRYYLPYQPVATRAQFTAAYPRSAELFAVKQRVDSTDKFTNALWDLYRPAADGTNAGDDGARSRRTSRPKVRSRSTA
jgi:hypothetical protein